MTIQINPATSPNLRDQHLTRIAQDGQGGDFLREDDVLRKKRGRINPKSRRNPPKTASKTRNTAPSPTERGTEKDVAAAGNDPEIQTRRNKRDKPVKATLAHDVPKRVGKALRNLNPMAIVEALPDHNPVADRNQAGLPGRNQVAIRKEDAHDRTVHRDDRQAARRARMPNPTSRHPNAKARRPPDRTAVVQGAGPSHASTLKRFHLDASIDSVRFLIRRNRN